MQSEQCLHLHIQCLAFYARAGAWTWFLILNAESILQTELSSQSFRVLCYISPKISLLINANCSLHLIIFIPDMITHKNSTCSVASILLAFPLWIRVKTITSQSNVPMSQWVTSFWNECDRKWEIYNFDIGHMGVKFFWRKINMTKTTICKMTEKE